jgi:hypothetical protein
MTYKQAKYIDLLLSICKDKDDRVQITTFSSLSDKFRKIPEPEFLKLIAIIRAEQLKLGVELIRGNSYSFKFFEPQITDLENLGGFKNLFWKNIKNTLFKYIFPTATLGILIWANFIKESDLKSKKETLENTKQIELKQQEQLTTKIKDSSNLDTLDYREHSLETIKSDSLK